MVSEELGRCDYCLNVGRKRNLAEVTWLYDKKKDYYCPRCLKWVIEDMKDESWVKKYGYEVRYPYK